MKRIRRVSIWLIAALLFLAVWNGHRRIRQRDLNAQLLDAVHERDPVMVQALIAAGADAASREPEGDAPLIRAEAVGNVEGVRLLIDHGADVDLRDPGQRTLLQRAAGRGNVEMVSALLELGAEVNTQDSNRRTPLAVAAQTGRPRVVEMLLGAGADANIPDHRGRTPLMLAARSGHAEVVDLLLRNGARLDARSGEGHSPLQYMLSPGLELPIFSSMAPVIGSYGRTFRDPLTQELTYRPADAVVRRLLAAGANVEGRDVQGRSLLDLAVGRLDAPTIDAIRHRGAPATPATDLLLGAYLGRIEEVRKALSAGAEVHVRDIRGQTALGWAVARGDVPMASLLLEAGADPNEATSAGEALLARAAEQRNTVMIRLLIRRGATRRPDTELARTDLFMPILRGDAEVVLALLSGPYGVDGQDPHGVTALMVAAEYGQDPVVRQLLNAGSGVNQADVSGATALLRACIAGHASTAKLLLAHGADPARKDSAGRSQLTRFRESIGPRWLDPERAATLIRLLER